MNEERRFLEGKIRELERRLVDVIEVFEEEAKKEIKNELQRFYRGIVGKG